jgi:hypothetical protein
MHATHTKAGPSRYFLGTLDGGRLYRFGDLGEFTTPAAALARAHALPMVGAVYVFEQHALTRHGVEFGLSEPAHVAVAHEPN